MFTDQKILAVQCMNTTQVMYALFCSDNGLYYGNDEDGFDRLAVLDKITLLDKPVTIYCYYPYICVTERFGLNAAVIDVRNNTVLALSREDYHADVSSYSIGFVLYDGHILLIHQTQWNRLDITDLETGRLLTEREILYKKLEGQSDENGSPKYEKKNYLDYFHSILHVAPDGKNFLSNGWVWSPFDNIRCYSIDGFLKEYELCSIYINYGSGYNWDRPCTFIDNDTFVIAADNIDNEDEDGYVYHQLIFYKLSDIGENECLSNYKEIDCDIFGLNSYGEAAGELYYDKKHEYLIAISEKGAFGLTLDGEIVWHNPSLAMADRNSHSDFGSCYAMLPNWKYDAMRHLFYRWSEQKCAIETCLLF